MKVNYNIENFARIEDVNPKLIRSYLSFNPMNIYLKNGHSFTVYPSLKTEFIAELERINPEIMVKLR